MIKKIIKAVFIFIGVILLIWQFAPSLILAPYNELSPVTTSSTNGQYIIDQNDNEFIEAISANTTFFHIELDDQYHSEGASVADINNDGLNDIVTGHYWYQAPNWQRHTIRTPLKEAVSIPKLSDHIKIYLETGGKENIWSKAYPLAFFTFHDDVNKKILCRNGMHARNAKQIQKNQIMQIKRRIVILLCPRFTINPHFCDLSSMFYTLYQNFQITQKKDFIEFTLLSPSNSSFFNLCIKVKQPKLTSPGDFST